MEILFICILFAPLVILIFLIIGCFGKKVKTRRICATLLFTLLLLAEVLLLHFDFAQKIALFVIQIGLVSFFVWNPHEFKMPRRLAYAGVLIIMVVSVCAVDIHINNFYSLQTIESIKPLKEQNYEPFTGGNVLAVLDEPPDIDFDKNYPIPKLDGATAMYPYYAAVYQTLYDENLDRNKYLKCSSSEYAFERLENYEADILFLAGVSDYQRENSDFAFTEIPLCRDAFVFVTSYQNSVRSLTIDEFETIYTGNADNWKQFGGEDTPITLYKLMGKNMGSNIALSKFIGEAKDSGIYEQTYSMAGVVYNVYRNGKGALGYTYRFFVTEMMKNYEVKLLSVNGIAPTVENIENGSYPFIKTFVAVKRNNNTNPNVKLLVDWLQSEQGQELAVKTGYVGLE
jgi:phosphate transport system substrate-binding protein